MKTKCLSIFPNVILKSLSAGLILASLTSWSAQIRVQQHLVTAGTAKNLPATELYLDLKSGKQIYVNIQNLYGERPHILDFQISQNKQLSEADLTDLSFTAFLYIDQSEVYRVLQMITEMFTPNTTVADFHQKPLTDVLLPSAYRSLCHRKGTAYSAKYRAYGRWNTAERIIGLRYNGCFGRCGKGCGIIIGRNIYTHECFVHDICMAEQGQLLGECAEEFWIASIGFMTAPTCD